MVVLVSNQRGMTSRNKKMYINLLFKHRQKIKKTGGKMIGKSSTLDKN